jgi:UDP-N-acetyl-D-glucosamine dehydrogenase
MMSELKERILSREARVAVVGAGYVGLPLAMATAIAGFRTMAYDRDPGKVRDIGRGVSPVKEIANAKLSPLVRSGKLTATIDPDVLRDADVIAICVPTPLNGLRAPDTSFILHAAEAIASRMRPQQLIVLESTTFPGFTREVLLPRLGASGVKLDVDFFLAFSPERVDPGNRTFATKNTPRVMGGSSAASLEMATAFYQTFVDRVVPVASTDTAEMVKLLENTFRAVNIALVNEVAVMCQRLNLNVWDVVEAAATKPFGFMPFFPGPGTGGHCVPIDPLYLSWKMRTLDFRARFIELADQVNSAMPAFVVQRVTDALGARSLALQGSRILLCGIAYKRDIDDVRESPAVHIIGLMRERGARVDYHDPHVPTANVGDSTMHSVPFDGVGNYDCVVIVTDHRSVDYGALLEKARLVVDCRNATRDLRGRHGEKIVAL